MAKMRLLCAPPLMALCVLALLLLAVNVQTGALSVASADGLIRYVSASGVDSGTCSNSASPCRTIQYAVDQAANQDEVRIATGVYTGMVDQAGLLQIVYVAKPITLRGGYAPPNWTTSDPVANPTILDAETQGRVMTIIGAEGVTVEGLRLMNGRSSGLGGLYMGQYTCGVLFGGSGAGGGVCIQDSTVTLHHTWILTNTAGTAGGRGGGLFATGSQLILTDSTIQGNNGGTGYNRSYGGGLFLVGGSAIIENNTITNNSADPNYDGDGGGIYALNTSALVRSNLFSENHVRGDTSSSSRLGGGGVAVSGGGVTITGNQFVGNQAVNYTGGGMSWSGGAITVTANLLQDNSASWGGGIWAGNASAVVDNNLLASNIATGHGSALYINTYSPNTASFRHSTIARNSGGDDVAVYVADYGRAAFYNTIMAENTIGVGMGWSTSIVFERTLWDNNITNTLGYIDEVGHLEGQSAFASDGFHLTEASDAVDAGIEVGLATDVDGEPRPQGSAPDIGADESPYGQTVGGEGVNIEKAALPPRLLLTTHASNGAPLYLIQQEYLIQVANALTSTALSEFSIVDWLPAELDFAAQVHYPPMDFSQIGNTMHWDSLNPLPPESLAWASLVGNAFPEDGGKVITNVASVTYTLAGGGAFSKDLQVASLIPNFPPFITFPENGEYCLDSEGEIEAWGIAKPGADVYLYADDVSVLHVTASITGTFYASFPPAHWATNTPVAISARDCTGGTCGDLSNVVTVRQPANGWCPQRSEWYGTLGENLFRWPFRNAAGEMSTQNFEIPGAYGFWNTNVKVYQCDPPDEGYAVTSIVVQADGVIYQDEDGAPDADGAWSFSVAHAHSVSITVSAENSIGATKTYTSHGNVLVDPDGFVFDVTQGLDVISSTQDGVPIEVGNALPGITVTCMVSMPNWGGWVPWPAQYFENQINPQVTGEDGYFAFFTPPGLYYLQVDGAEGYQPWRSPVIEVITEIVHVNVPLTPWPGAGNLYEVEIEQGGPSPAQLTIPAGSSVEWRLFTGAQTTLAELASWKEHPLIQARSGDALDPLTSPLGFDSGMLVPGQVYRRMFSVPGTYAYSDGAGHSAQVVVTGGYALYLPSLHR